MPSKLDPLVESRLMSAVDAVTADPDAVTDPSAAIVKLARRRNLTAGETSLVLRAFNIGRTNLQRESAESLLDKTAEFPLADPDRVRAGLAAASGNQLEKTAEPVTDYMFPPIGAIRRLSDRPRLAEIPKTTPPTPRTVDKGYTPYLQALSQGEILLRKKRAAIAASERRVVTAVGKLAAYFRRTDSAPFAAAAELTEVMHGSVGKQLFDAVRTADPGVARVRRGKVAAADELDATQAPFPEVRQCLRLLEDHGASQQALQQAYADVGETLKQASGDLPQPASEDAFLVAAEPDWTKVASGMGVGTPLGVIGTLAAGNRLLSSLPKKAPATEANPDVQGLLASLNDPEHLEQLRQIDAEDALQNLVLNDPIISGYPASAVADAYNQAIRTSPSAATQPLVLQPLLRKQLQQGQLDPYDVNTLLEIESLSQRRDQPQISGAAADGTVL